MSGTYKWCEWKFVGIVLQCGMSEHSYELCFSVVWVQMSRNCALLSICKLEKIYMADFKIHRGSSDRVIRELSGKMEIGNCGKIRDVSGKLEKNNQQIINLKENQVDFLDLQYCWLTWKGQNLQNVAAENIWRGSDPYCQIMGRCYTFFPFYRISPFIILMEILCKHSF